MFGNPNQHRSMPVGVVLRRSPGVTRWQRHAWIASAVLPGAGPADWRVLRTEGEVVEYHAATADLDLYGAETEAYLHGLQARVPSVYVVMRATGSAERPLEVVTITVSPYEAQDYQDSGEEIVEKIPMPPGLMAWVWEFVEAFHKEEVFIKRKRDKTRTDLIEDGIGDARITQTADVYRAPTVARKERLQ